VAARESTRLANCAEDMAARFAAGGRLFAFGNGGSATDAQELATLFLSPGGDAPSLPALGLANDTSVVTALCNDVGVDVVFARQLAAEDLPGWVRVADYGISGMHLAYDLADGYETAILVDAAPRGGEPGTVTVLEVAAEHRRDLAAAAGPLGASRLFDSHG